MTRSAAAPAAAKTISSMVGPPRCAGAAGGEWGLAGEEDWAPWDLDAAGGGEESLGRDGAGDEEALGGGCGGDVESADGGGAVEWEGEEELLFGGGDGAGRGGEAVEELDDMTYHETMKSCTSCQCPAATDALGHVRASPTGAAARPGERGWGGSRDRDGRRRGSAPHAAGHDTEV